MIPFSVLDLAPIIEGGTAGEALQRSRDLAGHAERWGYRRFWLAEHHNMPGVASAATAVAIAYVAGGTTSIRVGSGGIMLPNHPPLVIAEQFGTLAALFPGRIDLGVGRAPGTDALTAAALRRDRDETVDSFPQTVAELQAYFGPSRPGQPVRAIPGEGLGVPIWVLGSSLYGAQLAANLGLPFAFASHFAPDFLQDALDLYRRLFRPSPALAQPYAMAAIAVYVAETDAEAGQLFTSLQQNFLNLRRGRPGPLPPPVSSMAGRWTAAEAKLVGQAFGEAVVGSPASVKAGLSAFVKRTGIDELMVTAAIYDHAARLRSFQWVAEIRDAFSPSLTLAHR